MTKEKKKMGRPKGAGMIVWTTEQKRQAGRMYGIGCTLDQIAHIMGVSPATLDRMMERDAELSEALSKGRSATAMSVMDTAYQMAKSGKCPALTIFWLKTRMRWAEARDENVTDEDDKNEFVLNYKP